MTVRTIRHFPFPLAAAALVGAVALALPITTTARTFDFKDLSKIVNVSNPQISPDGKSIAFVVTRSNESTDKRDSELMLIDIASGAQRELTHERKDVGEPRWSPTGDRLAFTALAGEADAAQDQVWVMNMSGGDPKSVTTAENGVQEYAWRPDGQAVAYVSAETSKNKVAIKKHEDAFEVGDNDFLTRSASTPVGIWVAPADGGRARKVSLGSWSLGQGEFLGDISWSADGKRIMFAGQSDVVGSHFDRGQTAMVDVASGSVTPIGTAGSQTGYFSPDGQHVAYASPRHSSLYGQGELLLKSGGGGGAAVPITRGIDCNVSFFAWSPDSSALFVGANDNVTASLWRQPLAGTAEKIDLGEITFDFDASIGPIDSVALIGSTPRQPTELYYISGRGAAPKRLTNFNASIAALDLGQSRGVDWTGPNGMREDGVITLPPKFDPTKKYPLAMVIHGGPVSASKVEFNSLRQLFAAHGIIAFSPNYRGSDNFGDAYLQAIFGDVSSGPGADNLAGLAAVEKLGFVDSKRLGVSGWSGGGLATSWLIGHTHVFKAAMAGAAVTDWVDQYDLADINADFAAAFLGGSPWDRKYAKAYAFESPITYVHSMTTPTLILSDTGDYRVPTPQAYKLYHALKDEGVPVKFMAVPRYGHFPSDPVGIRVVDQLWVNWFVDRL
jgi:dipeptidyl aminopeptidase/acylaminoacyl peptidase